jgi:hypothetical protein
MRTLSHSFSTRRGAELAVERLVQEHGIERTDIFIAPEGNENSAGAPPFDDMSDRPSDEKRQSALASPICVSVDLQDDMEVALVKKVFAEVDTD